MMTVKPIVGLLLIIAWTYSAPAQGWRGIEPMKSTCQDVERLLGGTACGKKPATYKLPDESVSFVFSENGCAGRWPQELRYSVPTGTVIGISVMPLAHKPVSITDLKADLSKFRRTEVGDMIGAFKYISTEVGMYVTASESGQVLDFAYVPAARHDKLRCPPSDKPKPEGGLRCFH